MPGNEGYEMGLGTGLLGGPWGVLLVRLLARCGRGRATVPFGGLGVNIGNRLVLTIPRASTLPWLGTVDGIAF